MEKRIRKQEQLSLATAPHPQTTNLLNSLLSCLLHDTPKRRMYACVCVSVLVRGQCLYPWLLL